MSVVTRDNKFQRRPNQPPQSAKSADQNQKTQSDSMTCPRCKKANSYELRFNMKVKNERILLDARVCRVCEFIWADEKEHLAVVRKHLRIMTEQNEQKPSNSRVDKTGT